MLGNEIIGGTNDPADASASFDNTLNSIYLQDEIFLDERNMTVVAGLRYEFFTSDDRPNFNAAFTYFINDVGLEDPIDFKRLQLDLVFKY